MTTYRQREQATINRVIGDANRPLTPEEIRTGGNLHHSPLATLHRLVAEGTLKRLLADSTEVETIPQFVYTFTHQEGIKP